MAKDDFLEDKRTQQAVIMSLIIIGEAAQKVMDGYVEFARRTDVPWRNMRNMRNRMLTAISTSTSNWPPQNSILGHTACRSECRDKLWHQRWRH